MRSSVGQRGHRALLVLGTALLAASLFALIPATAAAQPAPPEDTAADEGGGGEGEQQGADKDEAPKVKVERGRGGRKVYRITQGFVIEGRIQKPNAFYVLQRSQINYDWAALKQDFVPRILEAVRQHPF
jgi:hypothetical protein